MLVFWTSEVQQGSGSGLQLAHLHLLRDRWSSVGETGVTELVVMVTVKFNIKS